MGHGRMGTAQTNRRQNIPLPVGEVSPQEQRIEPAQFTSNAFIQLKLAGDIMRNHRLVGIKVSTGETAGGEREAAEASSPSGSQSEPRRARSAWGDTPRTSLRECSGGGAGWWHEEDNSPGKEAAAIPGETMVHLPRHSQVMGHGDEQGTKKERETLVKWHWGNTAEHWQ